MPRAQVEQALKDLQAYSGQKLPLLDGFVAPPDKPLDQYERGFYQFSIELLPGDSGGTIVRLSAKITAWYADRDVTKSGYQVLASNGRLELDFLDRLEQKLTGKRPASPASAASNSPQAPQPKLDLSAARDAATMAAPLPQKAQQPDEVASLRNQRIAGEKHVQQLTAELQNLQDLQRTQAHPRNLIVVKKSPAPIYAKNAESSRVLFEASLEDEFEFLDVEGEWVHIAISGDSRGYVRRSAVELPEGIAAKLQSAPGPEEKFIGFRIEREDSGDFPGDWAPLKGKKVKIFTVQLLSQNPKETGPTVRLNYCLALFEKGYREGANTVSAPEGVVVIFDAADGGIAAATSANIQQLASGSLKGEAFWQQGYLDPPDAFTPASK
jgi:hypothetical protein